MFCVVFYRRFECKIREFSEFRGEIDLDSSFSRDRTLAERLRNPIGALRAVDRAENPEKTDILMNLYYF